MEKEGFDYWHGISSSELEDRLCITQACKDRGVNFLDVVKIYGVWKEEAVALIIDLMTMLQIKLKGR